MTNKRVLTVYLTDDEWKTVEELVKIYRASGYTHLMRLMLQDMYALASDKGYEVKQPGVGESFRLIRHGELNK